MAERIPREFIDQVIASADIVDIIDDFVPLKKNGANYKACCPFHNEKSASFVVSSEKQIYHCFGCGVGGNAISFLMDYERLSFIDSVKYLAKSVNLTVPITEYKGNKDKTEADYYQVMSDAVKFYQQQLKSEDAAAAKQYLVQRGLSGEIAKQFNIGFSLAGWDRLTQHLRAKYSINVLEKVGLAIKKNDNNAYDRFRERIIFPIRDRQGRFIGLGGRIIDQGEPKYLNSPETPIFHKGREMYGFYEMIQSVRSPEYIIIVEGYMDVLALAQHGISEVVATLGTATTSQHITTLFRYTDEVVFCFDGDEAGRKAAWRALTLLIPSLQDGKTIRFMFLPDGEDPDSFVREQGKESFHAARKASYALSEFFINHLTQQANTSSPEGRAKFAKLATELIDSMPDIHLKQVLINEVAAKSRLHPGQLQQQPARGATAGIPQRLLSERKALSPIRHAIALLLQYPELAKTVDQTIPETSSGHQFLSALIAFIKNHPQINTAGILEHYRDEKGYRELIQLANQPLLTPKSGIHVEFKACIAAFCHEEHEAHVERLFAKASKGLLTQDEKHELQQLLRKRSVPSEIKKP